MSFPTSINTLGKIIQATDGTYSETITIPGSPYTHVLGSGLSPAQPAGWQNVPVGAFPIQPPAACTSGSPTSINSSAGFLTAGATYKWVMTNVTDFGETTAGSFFSFTMPASTTVANLALPTASQGTADAPIRARRLYRTAANGSTYGFVAQINDLSLTNWYDGFPDAFLGIAPPSSNTSGSTGAVTISGGGVSSWTEVAPGSTLSSGQFIVDYSTMTTGGTITFAGADSGRTSVTITYTAATLANAPIMNNTITALKDIVSAFGAASGFATLDSGGHLTSAQFPASIVQGFSITGTTSTPALQLVTPTGATGENLYQLWLQGVGSVGYRWDIGQLADGALHVAKGNGTSAVDKLTLDQNGNLAVTGGFTVPGTVLLSGTTSNLINFGAAGAKPPSTATIGEKIRLWDGGSTATSYGIGIDAGTLWFNLPSGASYYKWYSNSAALVGLQLDNNGNLSAAGTVSGTQHIAVSPGYGGLNLTDSLSGGSQWALGPADSGIGSGAGADTFIFGRNCGGANNPNNIGGGTYEGLLTLKATADGATRQVWITGASGVAPVITLDGTNGYITTGGTVTGGAFSASTGVFAGPAGTDTLITAQAGHHVKLAPNGGGAVFDLSGSSLTLGVHELHAEVGAAPTVANGAQNTGTGGAAALESTYPEDDTHGVITITIGATATAGELAKVTFKNSYGTKPVVILSPVGANLGLQLYATPDAPSSGKAGFSILSDNNSAVTASRGFGVAVAYLVKG